MHDDRPASGALFGSWRIAFSTIGCSNAAPHLPADASTSMRTRSRSLNRAC
jgi:hypothetical protein